MGDTVDAAGKLLAGVLVAGSALDRGQRRVVVGGLDPVMAIRAREAAVDRGGKRRRAHAVVAQLTVVRLDRLGAGGVALQAGGVGELLGLGGWGGREQARDQAENE